MKLQKLLFPFGMIGSLAFLLDDCLGTILWQGYNPITSYFSQLIADGAPNLPLTRTLFYFYEICLVLFLASMLIQSFQTGGVLTRAAYAGLFLIAVLSLFGYGLFPMTMDFVLNPKNYLHAAVTVTLFAATVCLLFLLALGYRRQERWKKAARITLWAAVLFLLFNLLHFMAILSGQHELGLIERLSIYTFQTYFFLLSWLHVNRFPQKNRYR